jgi:hypothetical protein
MIWPFNKIIYHLNEWRKLRRCDTPEQFADYVVNVLKTPEAIAWWIQQSIYYENENPITWHPIEHALKYKRGNCSEMAALGVFALKLIGYKSEIMIIYGVDFHGVEHCHANASFVHGKRKGFIEGFSVVTSYLSWGNVANMVRSDWNYITRFFWTDNKGNTINVDWENV